VRPGSEMSMYYFSCLGGPDAVLRNRASGHVTSNMCFCIKWDLRVTWCIPLRPGHEMLTHYFSCSGGTGVVSMKSAPGHVPPNLFFSYIWWDLEVT
jgi:hypothetical protein